MYKNFGCCDSAKDQELMAKFYRIMDSFDYYGYASCAGYVQDIICQVTCKQYVQSYTVGYVVGYWRYRVVIVCKIMYIFAPLWILYF